MTLIDIIRIFVPSKLRITLGVWSINLASHYWVTLKAYLTILHGKPPINMGLTKTQCYYDYRGHRIFAPKNAAGVFLEIFQDCTYEQVWQPQPGDTVIDVGAYVGMFTVKASDAVGQSGRVIGIEPCPETFKTLRQNSKHCHNVRLVKKAIMSQTGRGKLYYSKSAAANSMVTQWGKYVEVDTITLDELVKSLGLGKVDFIKMDAEGAELDVLKGATGTLKRGTRLVIAAYHTTEDGKREINAVANYLKSVGYKVIYKKGLRSYIHAEKG